MLAVTYLSWDSISPQWGMLKGRAGRATVLHATAESQGWTLPCATSQVLWQGAGYLCTTHLEPGFCSTVRSVCLRSVLCFFRAVLLLLCQNPKALAGCPFEQAHSLSRTLSLEPQASCYVDGPAQTGSTLSWAFSTGPVCLLDTMQCLWDQKEQDVNSDRLGSPCGCRCTSAPATAPSLAHKTWESGG